MNSLTSNVLNEIEKLWKQRKTKVFLMLTLFIPVLSAISFSSMEKNFGINFGLGSNFPMAMLNLFTFVFLPLYLFMVASESFSGEVAARTLKLVLMRPITRNKVFASKVIAITFYIVVFLVGLMISSISLEWFLEGGNITSNLLDVLKAYITSLFPMLTIGLMSVFIAQIFNNSTGSMALSIFIYAAAKLLPFVFPQMAVWSYFSYTNWYILWIENGVSLVKLFNIFVLFISYCIIAYTLGLILFERKQL